MKIVVPTAGYGKRLRPHTWSKPKPLIQVAGNTVLGHVLDMFEQLPKIDEVIFIVGYLGDQIEEYVKDAYPHLNARYVEQKELIGQSHAIWLARDGLSGPMLMAFVDTLIEADLTNLSAGGAEAVGWVKEVPDPRRFGVAEVDVDGWVKRLVEKPEDISNNLAVVGFYYFQEADDLITAIEEQMERGEQLKGEYFLADAINIMLDNGLRMRVRTVDVWNDCGKFDAVLETNRYLLDHGKDNSEEAAGLKGVTLKPPVYVDPSAVVRDSEIGPYASIGPGCRIEGSVIQDSIIDSDTVITDTKLSTSLVGREVHISGYQGSLNIGDTSEVRTS
ncbi:MAG: NTP transferase domain-containing protein [Anaerolineales bacterium]|nr:NTP transferase domain-containing protein [Anaerolineales bacterium]